MSKTIVELQLPYNTLFPATTFIHIATNAFKYQSATGATKDSATGLLTTTEAQFTNLQSLHFNIGGVCYYFLNHITDINVQQTFELTPSMRRYGPVL